MTSAHLTLDTTTKLPSRAGWGSAAAGTRESGVGSCASSMPCEQAGQLRAPAPGVSAGCMASATALLTCSCAWRCSRKQIAMKRSNWERSRCWMVMLPRCPGTAQLLRCACTRADENATIEAVLLVSYWRTSRKLSKCRHTQTGKWPPPTPTASDVTAVAGKKPCLRASAGWVPHLQELLCQRCFCTDALCATLPNTLVQGAVHSDKAARSAYDTLQQRV